jgi:polysaccharide biosynthesis/export protein
MAKCLAKDVIPSALVPLNPEFPMNLESGCDRMKKLFRIGLIIGLIGVSTVLISVTLVRPEEGKEVLLQKKSQAEVVPDSNVYVIGPEDVLTIHVWKEETLSKTIPVRSDGKISLPLIDDIQAAGLTPLQLKEVLVIKLKEFIDLPNVSVIVTEANSFKVYVSGQVKNPGVYRLRSKTSLLQLIPMAGGFTEWANDKKILVIRRENGNEKRMTLNYQKIVKGEASNSNIDLQSGDTVIVP